MTNSMSIPANADGTYFSFNNYSRSFTVYVPDVVLINAYKLHDHRYDLKCFFYDKKYIYYKESIRSKKDLHNVVKRLLKEFL